MSIRDIVEFNIYNDHVENISLKGYQLTLFNLISCGIALGEDATNSYIHLIMSAWRASIAVQFMFDWK